MNVHKGGCDFLYLHKYTFRFQYKFIKDIYIYIALSIFRNALWCKYTYIS